MSRASIPVDLLNPGQVFASLGFLEAADAICSSAMGGFDWADDANIRFVLDTDGDRNPFEVVLDFLVNAEVRRLAPCGYKDPPAKSDDLDHSNWFPARKPDRMTLPVRLTYLGKSIDITHWADGSSREDFKLFAGNRSAATIVRAMLRGTRENPRKGQKLGDLNTKGICTLWEQDPQSLAKRPFDVLTRMGGSFNFDPRGAWTALDAGYSPNKQGHDVAASPVVEMLAAIGLEHARPAEEEKTRIVHYAAWSELLSPLLARPALSGVRFGVPLRTFRFELTFSGKNKIVNVGEEGN